MTSDATRSRAARAARRGRQRMPRAAGGPPWERLKADAVQWAAAESVAELGALTALWLEGRITSLRFNFLGGGPDEETRPHVAALAAVNRAGWMTEWSQPGCDHCGVRQRAGVQGFVADAGLLGRLEAAASAAGLLLLVHTAAAPGTPTGEGVVVTLDGGREFTWFGAWQDCALIRGGMESARRANGVDVDAYAGLLWTETQFQALCAAWQVTMIDPVWGRNDVLVAS